MPRGVVAEPRFHDTVTIPFPGWDGGMRVVMTREGPLGSLQSYMLSLGPISMTMQRRIAGAVGRLYDFYLAAPAETSRAQSEFMARFAAAVIRGTVRDGDDPIDLFWPPSTKRQARQVIRIATEFGDFCAEAAGTAPLNPTRDATFAERIVAYQRLAHRRKYDLLAHLGTPDELQRRAAVARSVAIPRENRSVRRDPPFFPFASTQDLVLRAFRVRQRGAFWEQYNVRDLMVAVLQRFGGLRASEALGLFVGDVDGVPVDSRDLSKGDTAMVRLFGPKDGVTRYREPLSGRIVTGTRETYLQTVYGLLPRNDPRVPPREHLGWKNLLIEHDALQCSDVHWFPQEWGTFFWELYRVYLRHVLPSGLPHPYLFVNTKHSAKGSDPYGRPLLLESYHESLERAVARIGLKSQKELGTTSHGLRHAYAQTLRRLGVSRKIRQVFLHHKNPLSQDPYVAPTAAEIAAEISAARARLAEAAPASLCDTSLLPPPAL